MHVNFIDAFTFY